MGRGRRELLLGDALRLPRALYRWLQSVVYDGLPLSTLAAMGERQTAQASHSSSFGGDRSGVCAISPEPSILTRATACAVPRQRTPRGCGPPCVGLCCRAAGGGGDSGSSQVGRSAISGQRLVVELSIGPCSCSDRASLPAFPAHKACVSRYICQTRTRRARAGG